MLVLMCCKATEVCRFGRFFSSCLWKGASKWGKAGFDALTCGWCVSRAGACGIEHLGMSRWGIVGFDALRWHRCLEGGGCRIRQKYRLQALLGGRSHFLCMALAVLFADPGVGDPLPHPSAVSQFKHRYKHCTCSATQRTTLTTWISGVACKSVCDL